MTPPRRAVLAAAAAAAAVWGAIVFPRLIASENPLLRLILTTLLAAAILLRLKPETWEAPLPLWTIGAAAGVGLPAVLVGNIFNVHQLDWLGLLLVLYACLRWSLPDVFSRDAARALFLLYWAHPLPAQVFGPMQLAMQTASVRGSEWILQLFNVRVWADGMILRGAPGTFEIPAWCSGMRAATTMFLLSAGLGMLRRYAWPETLAFVIAALAQALALNVVRIAAMVALAPSMAEKTGLDFLHDTAGVILLLGAVVLYAEMVLWDTAKQRRAARRDEPDLADVRSLRQNPPFWRVAARWGVPALLVLTVATAGVVLAYRGRTLHRADMLRGVTQALQDAGQYEAAQRAAEQVLALAPDDDDTRMTIVRLMLARGQYPRVLAALDAVPDRDADRATEKSILRAYALMSVGRTAEAAALVEQLPSRARERDPRVAMILAELGYRADQPDEVDRYVRPAAAWAPNTRRIRALYPYLRRYRRWEAISETDRRVPYSNSSQALAALEAHMNLNNAAEVALLALDATTRWPDDPRVLEPLFFMAMKRTDTAWEDRFAAHLVRASARLQDPDALATLADRSFDLGRPDLAWFLYRRLAALDSSHPYLPLMTARHGDAWFSFRKRRLGLSAAAGGERADLRAFYRFGFAFDTWRPLCVSVPCGPELSATNAAAYRRGQLARSLTEFEQRERSGELSLPMQYRYIDALDMAGDLDAVQERLRAIAEAHPTERPRVRVVLSEVYERRGDWESVYEVLRGYESAADPQILALLRLARACLNLRLGLPCLFVAQEAVRRFPGSSQAAGAWAAALREFDSPEEALFALSGPRPRHTRETDAIEAEALLATQRYAELQEFARVALLPPPAIPEDAPQSLFLPPAELAAAWHRALAFGDTELADRTRLARRMLPETKSPFLRRMLGLWIECHDAAGGGDTALADRWLGCGRDRLEKATALSQLALLLCGQQRFRDADEVLAAAVNLFPESAILWRMRISLSGARPDVAAAAREACPRDSDIWLANLVIRTQELSARSRDEAAAWADAEIRRAVESHRFSPGAMTRAAEYLLRGGMTGPAALAAESAVARGRGLLPACAVGIRCALRQRDRERAIADTRAATRAAWRPLLPAYAELVSLKNADGPLSLDAETVEALKTLRRGEPDNPLWAQMLGYVRFQRGGVEIIDALRHMSSALQSGATNRTPYLVAAEAARLRGSPAQAADFLRSGLRRYPGDLNMLNNLAFTLAATEQGAREALAWIPDLLTAGSNSFHVLDTAAVVYLQAGRTNDAERALDAILRKAERPSRRWFVTRTRQAEIALRRGDASRSLSLLSEAFKAAGGVPDEDTLVANELRARIEKKMLDRLAETNAPPP